MKIAMVLVLVLIGVWLFRLNRRSDRGESARQRTPPPEKPTVMALEMVRCRQCDVHLPKADAIAGKQGVYCSLEHRQRAES